MTDEQKLALSKVTLLGNIGLEEADDANIPVNISISLDDSSGAQIYKLSCDNYCPRKGCVYDCQYVYSALDDQSLRELVRLFIKPLYEVALKKIDGMIDGTGDNLYYWS